MPDLQAIADDSGFGQDGVSQPEAAGYEALKRKVFAEQSQKQEEERGRRIDLGLPPELASEEKKEIKRRERAKKTEEKERGKDARR